MSLISRASAPSASIPRSCRNTAALPLFRPRSLNGETETGVTLYLLGRRRGLRAGHRAIKTRSDHETRTRSIRSRKNLRISAGHMLVETIPSFYGGKITPMPQNEADATFTKKFKTEDGFVESDDLRAAENGDPEKAAYLDRKIRALNPEPGVWTTAGRKTPETS